MNKIFKHIILFAIYFTVAVIFLHPSTAVIIATILTAIPGVVLIIDTWVNSIRSMIYKSKGNMARVVIHKHFRRPLFIVPKWFVFDSRKSFTIKRYVRFTEQSKYDNKKYPGVQKLVGFSLWHPHFESYRAGWEYNKKTNQIELCSYIHRKKQLICRVFDETDINQTIELKIDYYNDRVIRYYLNGFLVASIKIAYKYRFAIAWLNNPYAEIKQRISFLMK